MLKKYASFYYMPNKKTRIKRYTINMIIKKKITIKECFRNYLFYLLINSIFVSNCNQTRRYDLFQFHGSPGTRKRNKQLYDKGEQICANTLFKPVASSEIKNDLSHLSYLVYTEFQWHLERTHVRLFYRASPLQKLKNFHRNFFSTITLYFHITSRHVLKKN